MNKLIIKRGCSKTSAFGETSFACPRLTGLWNRLKQRHGLFHPMLILAFAVMVFAGCRFDGPDHAPDRLIIGSWNVQALFDGKDNGSEYDDYREAALWNENKYRARLTAVSRAIQCMDGGGLLESAESKEPRSPGIMALIEIENLQVLEDLAAMPGMSYNWLFFANTAGTGLGTGVLSRFPIRDARTHGVIVSDTEAPRPVAEVWIDIEGGEPLVLLVCHWKSKLGGEKATEPARRAAAMVISRRLEEIERNFPGTPVIILGDLNENHDEALRVDGDYTTALLGDYSKAAGYVPETVGTVRPGMRDFLVLSGNKPPRAEYVAGAALFSPWMERENRGGMGNDMDIMEENSARPMNFQGEGAAGGSYYYKDQWETIDHFLLNGSLFDGTGWEYYGFSPLSTAPFTKGASPQEAPDAFNPRTGAGLADHLPILLSLVWNVRDALTK
jgi:endonuclease/exonuclease/phosphatase family metal-dependent hydrolase